MAPTTVDGNEFSITGGGVARIEDNKLLFLGGVNKVLFDDAVYQLQTLKGDELTAYTQKHFNLAAEDLQFSRRQVIYDMQHNTW